MPGILRCDRIDLNDPEIVSGLIRALTTNAQSTSSVHRLHVDGAYHFVVSGGPLSSDPGWYVICDEEHRTLYVGATKNLNKRLNTPAGSRDNFANPTREQDPVRNFVKAFASARLLPELYVVTIPERSICSSLGV
ncbi:GIY-YIG nuclease family protein, partial [Acidobacteria bacterium AH-259-D05]|nr:GIY-YIG nuclease family protein [Acidobacteria bacterium AH-259-D05]